jgi:rRNA maturation RNase YbeY
MKIEINNSQSLRKVNRQKIKKLTNYLINQTRKVNPRKEWKEISVMLTDNNGICTVNRKHLSSSETTDVISFCYDPIPGDNNLYSAEIVVNIERAIENNSRWTASRELALYIAHGCNHLTGADDQSRADRMRMRRRELRWLKEADCEGILEE